MRQLLLAAGVVCATGVAANWVVAQNQGMPGQVVGSGYTLHPVGHAAPQAAPKVGQPINMPVNNPMMRPYDPRRPYDAFKGTNIDPKLVIAPAMGDEGNVVTRAYDKVKSVLGLTKTVAPQPMVTPGLFRRNRERAAERMWRRD